MTPASQTTHPSPIWDARMLCISRPVPASVFTARHRRPKHHAHTSSNVGKARNSARSQLRVGATFTVASSQKGSRPIKL